MMPSEKISGAAQYKFQSQNNRALALPSLVPIYILESHPLQGNRYLFFKIASAALFPERRDPSKVAASLWSPQTKSTPPRSTDCLISVWEACKATQTLGRTMSRNAASVWPPQHRYKSLQELTLNIFCLLHARIKWRLTLV